MSARILDSLPTFGVCVFDSLDLFSADFGDEKALLGSKAPWDLMESSVQGQDHFWVRFSSRTGLFFCLFVCFFFSSFVILLEEPRRQLLLPTAFQQRGPGRLQTQMLA